MTTVSWDVPGPGAWELETTHAVRPATPWGAEAWQYGYVRGFRYGTARYGGLLDYLEPAVVNGFMYSQPRAYGAPAGAAGPPPLPVLWLLTRLVPKLRARIKLSEAAFATKLWRADLAEWDAVDRPDIVARHRGLQAIDPSSLTDADLADHLLESREHLKFSHWIHHKYSVAATLTAGDLLAGAMAWTGCGPGEILRLIRGNSDISLGFCADELGAAAMAIRSDAGAQAVLAGGGATCDAQQVLDELVAGTASGDAVAAYLEAVRYRGMGYDVGDKNAGEMPDVLLGAIRSAVEGAAPAPAEDTLVSRVRARVPEAHAADFDDRLAEARLMSRLRDERGAYSDGWATGLARRAILEAGRRLVATDRLADAEHAVDLSPDELVAMLRGGPGPAADEVAGRYLGGRRRPPGMRRHRWAEPRAPRRRQRFFLAPPGARSGPPARSSRICSRAVTASPATMPAGARTSRWSGESRCTRGSMKAPRGSSVTPASSSGSNKATCSSPRRPRRISMSCFRCSAQS